VLLVEKIWARGSRARCEGERKRRREEEKERKMARLYRSPGSYGEQKPMAGIRVRGKSTSLTSLGRRHQQC